MILTALIAARWVHFVALAVAFGAALAALESRSASAEAAGPRAGFKRWVRSTLAVSSVLILLTAAAMLGLTAANLSGSMAGLLDVSMLQVILQETDFGRVWAVRLAAAAVLAFLALAGAAQGRIGSSASMALASVLLASLALTGHAAVEGGATGWIHRLADAAHLIAAGVWLGALPPFLHTLHASARSGDAEQAAFTTDRLVRFHTIGLIAVLTLVATGLVNSWFLVGAPANLVSTPYGLILIAKLALFAIMVALAADNRLRLVPALARSAGEGMGAGGALRRLRRSVLLEWGLGLAVLAAVAVLGAIAPAVDA